MVRGNFQTEQQRGKKVFFRGPNDAEIHFRNAEEVIWYIPNNKERKAGGIIELVCASGNCTPIARKQFSWFCSKEMEVIGLSF